MSPLLDRLETRPIAKRDPSGSLIFGLLKRFIGSDIELIRENLRPERKESALVTLCLAKRDQDHNQNEYQFLTNEVRPLKGCKIHIYGNRTSYTILSSRQIQNPNVKEMLDAGMTFVDGKKIYITLK